MWERRLLPAALVLAACGGGDRAGEPDGAVTADAARIADAAPPECAVDDDCDDTNPCTQDVCASGRCSNEAHREGEVCNDGLVCTDPDLCAGGVCVGRPRECGALADVCATAVCDEELGDCARAALPDGTPCDDGTYCTENDQCAGGACTGTARDCAGAGDACNAGECAEVLAACVAQPVADDTPCDDSAFCTTGDRCLAGACVGASPAPCNDGDACTVDTCDTATDACANPPGPPVYGAEGPSGTASCTDGIDNDCDGAVDGSDPSCVPCTIDADCDDGNDCTADSCVVDACDNAPLTGPACDDGLTCTEPGTCAAGACVAGAPLACDDGDPCTADVCDPGTGACAAPALAIDPLSPVQTTSNCLVAGSGARALIWTELRDQYGAPVSGSSVAIGGIAATEAAGSPGTYFREVTAAAAPMTEVLDLTATACGTPVVLDDAVTLEHETPNTSSGGTGGCAPAGGNLRVRVVDDAGAPIAGAAVLVGDTEGDVFEGSAEAAFGGASSPGSNTGVTAADGSVEFLDYAGALDGPFTVTAGADGRAYVTFVHTRASDIVAPLPPLHPPPVPTTRYDLGTADVPVANCDDLDIGIVLPPLPLERFSDMQLDKYFGAERCWESENDVAGSVAIPDNVWIPEQTVGFSCLLPGAVAEGPWSIALPNTAATGRTETVTLLHVGIPMGDVVSLVLDGGNFMDLLATTRYHGVGFLADETVPTPPTSGRSIDEDETYAAAFRVVYSQRPAETDIIGFALGDLDGGNGTGPLAMLGHAVHPWDEPGSAVVIPTPPLTDTDVPAGVRRLASISAAYLDQADHPAIASNRLAGVSTALIRETDGAEPYGADGGEITVGSLLDLAGADVVSSSDFVWDNATRNGNVPLYSRHQLMMRTRAFLPVLSCKTENDRRKIEESQWIVFKPFGLECGDRECFTLPTLPAWFPRAGEPRPGFEPIVGSGAACAGPGDCGAGETCVDPDGDGAEGMLCLAGSGTGEDPWVQRQYFWVMRVFDLELAPAPWSFDAFELASHDRWVTHETTNRLVFQ